MLAALRQLVNSALLSLSSDIRRAEAPRAAAPFRQRPTRLLIMGWGALLAMYLWVSVLSSRVSLVWEIVWFATLLFPLLPWWINRTGLKTLSLAAQPVPAFHAGSGHWLMTLTNPRRTPLGELVITANPTLHIIDGELASLESAQLSLNLSALPRGQHRLGPVHIACAFPFGLFSLRRRFSLSEPCLVYPALEPDAPAWPPSAEETARVARAGEEVVAFRDYISGDPLSTIDWKLSARRDGLIVRQFEPPAPRALVFSLDQVAGLPLEQGLSRLASWIVRAEVAGHAYALILGAQRLPRGQGPAHRHACLSALALCTLDTPA